MESYVSAAFMFSNSDYYDAEPTPIWYYLTFIDTKE